MTKNEEKAIEILKNTRQAWCRILSRYIDKQQKEIERLKFNNHMVGKWNEYLDKDCISKDKIMAKIEELEKQAKEMKYDYDVSYAEEDLFNKNVKFFKEQMQKLLGE